MGPDYNEFGYNEHLIITSRFKIIDCSVKKFCYNENPFITSSFLLHLFTGCKRDPGVSGRVFESGVYLGLGLVLDTWYAELDEGVDHRPGGHVLTVHLTHNGAHVVFVRDEVGVLGAKLRQLGLVRRLEGRHAAGFQRLQQWLEVRREREEHDVLGLGPLDHPRTHVALARVVQHQHRVLGVPGHRDVAVLPEVARQDLLDDGGCLRRRWLRRTPWCRLQRRQSSPPSPASYLQHNNRRFSCTVR